MLFTDHDELKHLDSQVKVLARHASWIAYLQQFTFSIRHKSRKLNRVADALSRRHTLLTAMHVSVPGFTTFSELYEYDPYFSSVLAEVKDGACHNFTMTDGFLFKGIQLCIPDCSFRVSLIKKLHVEGHVGCDRTLQLF